MDGFGFASDRDNMFEVSLDVISIGIGFLAKRHRAVNSKVSMEKGTCGQPHPVTSV